MSGWNKAAVLGNGLSYQNTSLIRDANGSNQWAMSTGGECSVF